MSLARRQLATRHAFRIPTVIATRLSCSVAASSYPLPPLLSDTPALSLGREPVTQRQYSDSARSNLRCGHDIALSLPCAWSSFHSSKSPLSKLRYQKFHGSSRLRSLPPSKDGQKAGEPSKEPNGPRPTQQIAQRLNEKTKDLKQKVKSSLTNLTPHENIYNIPNFLTATRLVAAPVCGYLIVQGDLKWALGLFFYAGVTDLIDGWMARRFHLQTVVGSVIDPMADKLLMTVMTVSLAAKGLMPAYLATLILGRDITLAVAAIYYRYASLPAPKTFTRYWDFSLPSAQVHPTTVSKYNTFLQLVLIGGLLAVPVVAAEPYYTQFLQNIGTSVQGVDQGITYFEYLVAATTAWSGLSYAVLKDAVTILGTNEELKAKQGKRGRAIIGVSFGTIVLVAVWLALFRDAERREVKSKKEEK